MKKLFVTLFVTAGLCSFNSAFSQTTLVGTWENITQKGKSNGKPVTEFWRFSADTMFWMQGPEKMPQYDAKKIIFLTFLRRALSYDPRPKYLSLPWLNFLNVNYFLLSL